MCCFLSLWVKFPWVLDEGPPYYSVAGAMNPGHGQSYATTPQHPGLSPKVNISLDNTRLHSLQISNNALLLNCINGFIVSISRGTGASNWKCRNKGPCPNVHLKGSLPPIIPPHLSVQCGQIWTSEKEVLSQQYCELERSFWSVCFQACQCWNYNIPGWYICHNDGCTDQPRTLLTSGY